MSSSVDFFPHRRRAGAISYSLLLIAVLSLNLRSNAQELTVALQRLSPTTQNVIGGQPDTEAPSVAGTFQVKGSKTLPE